MKSTSLLKKIRAYRGEVFASASYKTQAYETFELLARKWLMYLCKEHGWDLITFGDGHFDYYAFIGNNGKYANILSYDCRCPGWYDKMVYRAAADENDHCGGSNHWTSYDHLEEGLVQLLGNN